LLPKNSQQTPHLLDKYSKTTVPKATQCVLFDTVRGCFAQKARRPGKGNHQALGKAKSYYKEYWKDKWCFKYDERGHPSTHFPYDDDEDVKFRSSQAKIVKKLEKEVKSMKNAFVQMKETKGESDLFDSSESEGKSHFKLQFART
jgi:hypothetical protein